MHFQHSADIWRDFRPGRRGLYAEGITSHAEGITSHAEGITSTPMLRRQGQSPGRWRCGTRPATRTT